MGQQEVFQPLTPWDKVSVFLYRTGIALTTLLICAGGILFARYSGHNDWNALKWLFADWKFSLFVVALYCSVGICVFTIHLYIKKFRKFIKFLYALSIISLLILFSSGAGHMGRVLFETSYGPLLLLPLSGCIGFIIIKEAFCFRLNEGYILAIIIPLFTFLFPLKVFSPRATGLLFLLIAAMLVFFSIRKVPMPFHYDIGDKSAYEK
jgi:uncharacterized integral membrane protein